MNLGAALAERGHPVLIVDLDPQAHATLHLGVDAASPAQASAEAPPTVYDLLMEEGVDPRAAVRLVRPNLSIIPSETDLSGAETELAALVEPQRRLARALGPLAGQFAFVLIDCPPSLGLLTVNALTAAGEVVVPMQAHFLALQGLGKLLETVRLIQGGVGAGLNPALRITGVVLCVHDANTTHAQEVVADIDGFFEAARERPVPWRGARVLRPPIRRNIKLAECPSFGQTIFDYAPQASGAADYRALARSVLGEAEAPAPGDTAPVVTVAIPEGVRPAGAAR